MMNPKPEAVYTVIRALGVTFGGFLMLNPLTVSTMVEPPVSMVDPDTMPEIVIVETVALLKQEAVEAIAALLIEPLTVHVLVTTVKLEVGNVTTKIEDESKEFEVVSEM